MKKKDRRPLVGTVAVPGDKSISHRALVLAALGRGHSSIGGLNTGADVRASGAMLAALGVRLVLSPDNTQAEVEGEGWSGLREPSDVLDAGNSGTSLRILLGICAGIPALSVLTGDASLRARPMLRVVVPLRQMGAFIDGREHGDRAPVVVRGGRLSGADLELPVASAQVKSAVLLAGLSAEGRTSVTEPGPSRDHTERMLAALGVPVERSGQTASVPGGAELEAFSLEVPGDTSSATFFVAAAALVPGSELTVSSVALNPTRIGAFEVLKQMGADIGWESSGDAAGEPVGDVWVRHGPLRGVAVEGHQVPTLIDEIPALAVVATQAEGETRFRDAGELRVKESDRIRRLVEGLQQLGADVEELPDGLAIRGPTPLQGGQIDSGGDHRMAMSFAVAGLVAREKVRILGWSSVETSFPEFLDVLGKAQA